MNTNLLVAIKNFVKEPILDIKNDYASNNRINSIGDALEYYIQDLFCNSVKINNLEEKNRIYNKYFSYLGNPTTPPDAIIKNGDAIEVKKLETATTDIPLNSSHPKDKIYADSPMITSECRNCEEWKEKDLLYSIGVVQGGKLKILWFVYGDCYAAKKEIYEKVKQKIADGIREVGDIELGETRELARLNRVDPLGITYLRVRGMWHIKNPINAFNYVASIDRSCEFNLNAILLEKKYNSFPAKDRKALESLKTKGVNIKNIELRSPNNRAKLLKAKLISFKICE